MPFVKHYDLLKATPVKRKENHSFADLFRDLPEETAALKETDAAINAARLILII